MKKFLIYLLRFVIAALIFGYILFYFFSNIKVKYSLRDCVTYFDENGQYQLISIGNRYFFYDAKEEKEISQRVRYYINDGNDIYAILESGDYFYLNIQNSDIFISGDINEFDSEIRESFSDMDTSELRDLTSEIGDLTRYLLKFVPLKLRKW